MKPESDYSVGEFMTKGLVEVSPGATAANCAKFMEAGHVSSVVVTENNRLLGIVTEKDLARKIVAKGLDPNTVVVRDIMSKNPVTIEPDASLYDAMLKLNSHKIKHLPVVKDNIPAGMITAMDILRIQPSYMEVLSAPRREEPEE